MKKGQIYNGYVEEIRFPNKGIVTIMEEDEKGNCIEHTCVVKNAVPGQNIQVQIQKMRKGVGEGRMVALNTPGEDEIKSPCPHFGTCGGCNYQSLPYEKQLAIKSKQVEELLWHVIKGTDSENDYKFEGIKGSPITTGYRNKMEFSFGDEYKDGPLALGMHKRGSFYDLVTVSDCQIVDEGYRVVLKYTRDFFAKEPVTFYHRMRHEGYLRHLLVRKAGKTGEMLVALVTTSQIDSKYERDVLLRYQEGLVQKLLNNGLHNIKLTGILHTVNDSVADVVQSDHTEILYGKDYFYEELLGLKFRISEFSFFQNNSPAAEILYQTARDYLGNVNPDGNKDKIVYDLYSGTGTIAQLMAPVASKVIGVEIVEEAVLAARENAKENGLENCKFIAADVLKALDEIEEKPDYIILDPPRDGIHPRALEKILKYGVDRIVYISCKPTSLARDLETILANGYQIEKAVAVDMFPGTVHVETIVALHRKDT